MSKTGQLVMEGMPAATRKGRVKEHFEPHKAEYTVEQIQRALSADVIALDTETDTEYKGIGPEKKFGATYVADVNVIALVWREGNTLENLVMSAPFTADELAVIEKIMTGDQAIIGHNLVFDMRQLSKLVPEHRTPDYVWDTMVMARLIHPGKQIRFGNRFNLLAVAKALDIPLPEYMAEMKEDRDNLHNVDPRLVQQYCADDTLITYQIYEKQRAMVTADYLKTLVEWECRAVRVYCQMAAKGVCLNVPYTQKRIVDLSRGINASKARLVADGLEDDAKRTQLLNYIYVTKSVPRPEWNPGSPLFTAKGHKRLGELAASNTPYTVELSDLSLDKDAMEELLSDESPYKEQLKDLRDYSQADYMLRTMQALLDHAVLDGRAHSIVTIATDTGRRAATNPQVQNWKMAASNIVAGDMSGVAMGDPGCTLVEIDYSNAENWIAAMISGDNNLAAACAAEDFHSAMAASYWPELWNDLHEHLDAAKAAGDTEEYQRYKALIKELRKLSKTVTFGTAYGMGAVLLALRIHRSVDESKAILKAKDAAFPLVASEKRATAQRAKKDGYASLWTGRRVVIPRPQDYGLEAGRDLSYTGWNYLCQGGVGEMIKRSIVLITEQFEEQGMKSRVALDMHDAIILSVAHEEWQEALNIATHVMETVMPSGFNQRTTPNIQWIARPDIAENAKKWGKGQPQPGDTDFSGVMDPLPDATPTMEAPHQESADPQPAVAPNLVYIVSDLDWQLAISFRVDVPVSQLNVEELASAANLHNALIERIKAELSAPRETTIPKIQGGKYLGKSGIVKVNFENWVKVASAWINAAELCDPLQEIGATKGQILMIYEDRRSQHLGLQTRLKSARSVLAVILQALANRGVEIEEYLL